MTTTNYNEFKQMLIDNQNRRKQAIDIYKDFIQSMIDGKQKGIRYRKWLRLMLFRGAETLFKTEEYEYQFIGKFGRGIFDIYSIKKSFNKEEQATIVEIAKLYGAFDY